MNHPLSRYFMAKGVQHYWDSMLHPPLSYRGDAFQYRSADGADNVGNILIQCVGRKSDPFRTYSILNWERPACLMRNPSQGKRAFMAHARIQVIYLIVSSTKAWPDQDFLLTSLQYYWPGRTTRKVSWESPACFFTTPLLSFMVRKRPRSS